MDSLHINALTTAYNALVEQFGKGEYEKNFNNCYYAIGTMLHWLLDIIERLDIDKSRYSEFRFINNQLKHNKNIIELHLVTGGLHFPEAGIPFGIINDDGTIEPTLTFPAYELIWKIICSDQIEQRYLSETNYIRQFESYVNKLQGKSIIETFSVAYNSILKEINDSDKSGLLC